MIFRYVYKNLVRRWVRTLLMLLSLMISTGLIVALSATVETIRRSNVDLIASGVGRFDLSVRRTDITPDPFIEIERTAETIYAADDRIVDVFPRFESIIELSANDYLGNGYMIALDPAVDTVGFIDVISGTYDIGNGDIVVFEQTASSAGLEIGDTLEVAYSFPRPREEFRTSESNVSERRAVANYTVVGVIRQDGVTGAGVRDGFIMHIDDAQTWLNLPGRAEQLIAIVDPVLYESRDAETSALQVREVAARVQAALGDTYTYSLLKAQILDGSSQAFLVLQALINTYGLLALGIVGLLVYTLVMTNVQEQRRDMAVLRILGSQRGYLFAMVLAEVALIGLIGIGLGIGIGQLITRFLVVPFIAAQLSSQGLTPTISPTVNLTAVLPAVLSATIVLIVSTLKPARDAASTKVMHAINPGVADNIQIDDIANLRERQPTLRMMLTGLVMLIVVMLVFGLDIVANYGLDALQASLFLGIIILMVLGLGLFFFVITVPFEKIILFVMGLILPRVTYFAQKNVGRGQTRNTLISLLVLFSGVLPSFLATQTALDNANLPTSLRIENGAPVVIRTFRGFGGDNDRLEARLEPSFIPNELEQIEGINETVGLTYEYRTQVADPVGMRSGSIAVVGVDGDLDAVLFQDMVEFVNGSTNAAFDQIMSQTNTVIVSEGLAEGLAIELGDTIQITGQGLDHVVDAQVVGIARRIAGFSSFGRVQASALGGSQVLMSKDSFRSLITDPLDPLPPEDDPIIERILATLDPGADPELVAAEMDNRFSLKYDIFSEVYTLELEQAIRDQAQQQTFLLVLTVISFTTAVFGVFAVIYVTIYSRRLEIGMMKAIGTRRRELTGMLAVESITMTLSAALAGITAGAMMGYFFSSLDSFTADRPFIFAIDTTVAPFVVIMVVIASIIGTFFSARRIVKRRAIEILRM